MWRAYKQDRVEESAYFQMRDETKGSNAKATRRTVKIARRLRQENTMTWQDCYRLKKGTWTQVTNGADHLKK